MRLREEVIRRFICVATRLDSFISNVFIKMWVRGSVAQVKGQRVNQQHLQDVVLSGSLNSVEMKQQ